MILFYSDWVSVSDYFGWDINRNIHGLIVSTGAPVRNELSKVSPRTSYQKIPVYGRYFFVKMFCYEQMFIIFAERILICQDQKDIEK